MSDKYLLKRVNDGEEFPLTLGSLLAGRSDSCDIRVISGQASREHARIRAREEGVWVEDLHSTNDTYINDKQIEGSVLMKPGDVVRFDQEEFSLQRQGSNDLTIYARPLDLNARSGMSIEEHDEEDLNSTVYRQSFVLPPGWQDIDMGSDQSSLDERKQKALDNYIAKAFQKLAGSHHIALIFTKAEEPPVIKTLATDDEQRWNVGRSASCDVCVEQPDISELHCYVVFDGKQWRIEDNKSTNGIWLKNKKQTSLVLSDGSKFHLASVGVEVKIHPK